MHRINWRLAVLPDLDQPTAPRVLSTETLSNMIAIHRPHIAKKTMISVINDLVTVSAVRQISSDLFLNQRCNPPAVSTEAASYIRKDAVLSLQSALHGSGAIQHEHNRITAVCPDTHLKVWDTETIFVGQESFDFHILPAEYFPPVLPDYGDVIDMSKPYPCFTPEKALLDWLFLQKSCNAELPLLSDFNLTKLDMPNLFELAKRMKLRYLLERFLSTQKIVPPASDSTVSVFSSCAITRNIVRIPSLLSSLHEAWERNPELSLGQLLAAIGPKNLALDLAEVKDSEWKEDLAAFQFAVSDNAGIRGLQPHVSMHEKKMP